MSLFIHQKQKIQTPYGHSRSLNICAWNTTFSHFYGHTLLRRLTVFKCPFRQRNHRFSFFWFCVCVCKEGARMSERAGGQRQPRNVCSALSATEGDSSPQKRECSSRSRGGHPSSAEVRRMVYRILSALPFHCVNGHNLTWPEARSRNI